MFWRKPGTRSLARWQPIKTFYPELCLHLIGSLQSNKAADAVSLFDVFIQLTGENCKSNIFGDEKQNKQITCFIQVNIGYEIQKSGIEPKFAVDFAKSCINDYALPIIGFMCIPPANEDASPYFAYLKTCSKAGLNHYLWV